MDAEPEIPGQAMRAFRTRVGWTQDDLAKRLGVHRTTVISWEQSEDPIPKGPAKLLSQLMKEHQYPVGGGNEMLVPATMSEETLKDILRRRGHPANEINRATSYNMDAAIFVRDNGVTVVPDELEKDASIRGTLNQLIGNKDFYDTLKSIARMQMNLMAIENASRGRLKRFVLVFSYWVFTIELFCSEEDGELAYEGLIAVSFDEKQYRYSLTARSMNWMITEIGHSGRTLV